MRLKLVGLHLNTGQNLSLFALDFEKRSEKNSEEKYFKFLPMIKTVFVRGKSDEIFSSLETKSLLTHPFTCINMAV